MSIGIVARSTRACRSCAFRVIGAATLTFACSLQDWDALRDVRYLDAGGPVDPEAGGASGAGGTTSVYAGASGLGGEGPSSGGTGGASNGGSTSSNGGAGGAPGSGGSAGSGGVGGAAGHVGTATDAGAESIIADPGFEEGTGAWVGWGGQVLVWHTQGPLAGGHCLASTNRADYWVGPSYYLTDIVTPGALYEVTLWIRTAGVNQPIQLTTKTLCVGDQSSSFSPFMTSTSQNYWQEFSGRFVAPSCNLAEFRVFVEGPPAGQNIYIDEVRLVEVVQ